MYLAVNLILISITLILGAIFLAIPVPENLGLKNYKISLKILSSAYFVIAFLNALLIGFDSSGSNPQYFSFVNLLVSSLQALLFTFTLITLINPSFVSRKRLLKNLIAIFTIPVLYITSYFLFGDCIFKDFSDFGNCITFPSFIFRFIFFLFYCAQLIYFLILFVNEENKYKQKLNDYFSETTQLQLKWVTYAFYFALFIGLLALAFQIFPDEKLEIVFPVIVAIFYSVFAIKYLNYNKLYLIIEPAFEKSNNTDVELPELSITKGIWRKYKAQIISEKYYLKEGITLEEIAGLLKIGRTTLSKLINSEEKINFNSWINQLRIEEAKILFLERPECTIVDIAEKIGYSEHSNFSRQFKIITGESPSDWRKKQSVS
jgi:AraC-like DNA-binding protein